MTSEKEYELIKMFKWAVNKFFDNHPDDLIKCEDLEHAVKRAWHDMVQEGTIILSDETEDD